MTFGGVTRTRQQEKAQQHPGTETTINPCGSHDMPGHYDIVVKYHNCHNPVGDNHKKQCRPNETKQGHHTTEPRFCLVLANIGPFTNFTLKHWTPR